MPQKKIDREKIKKMLDNSKDDSEIAEELDCSEGSIKNIRVKEFGIKKRPGLGDSVSKNTLGNCIKMIKILMRNPFIEERALKRKFKSGIRMIRKIYKELIKQDFPIVKKTIGLEQSSRINKHRIYFIDKRFLYNQNGGDD